METEKIITYSAIGVAGLVCPLVFARLDFGPPGSSVAACICHRTSCSSSAQHSC